MHRLFPPESLVQECIVLVNCDWLQNALLPARAEGLEQWLLLRRTIVKDARENYCPQGRERVYVLESIGREFQMIGSKRSLHSSKDISLGMDRVNIDSE